MIAAREPFCTIWSYHPVISFRTEKDGEITFTNGADSYPAEYVLGDAVEVRYDPENPQDARVYRWINLWVGPLLLIGWTIWRDMRAERHLQAAR